MAVVRNPASKTFYQFVQSFKDDNPELVESTMNEIKTRFYESDLFFKRQAFVNMCSGVMNHEKDIFEQHMKSAFCKLKMDKVANVRIVLAKVIKEHLSTSGGFYFDSKINKTIAKL